MLTPDQVLAIDKLCDDIRDRAEIEPSLALYYMMVAQSMRDLSTGDHLPEELLEFTIYDACRDLPSISLFRQAFGRELGFSAGWIASITQDLKALMEDK